MSGKYKRKNGEDVEPENSATIIVPHDKVRGINEDSDECDILKMIFQNIAASYVHLIAK